MLLLLAVACRLPDPYYTHNSPIPPEPKTETCQQAVTQGWVDWNEMCDHAVRRGLQPCFYAATRESLICGVNSRGDVDVFKPKLGIQGDFLAVDYVRPEEVELYRPVTTSVASQ